MPRIPNLPDLVKTKINKTGQTRGATDGEIYQNRVSRNGVVLIPYECYDACLGILPEFHEGYIYIIRPEQYFESEDFELELASKSIVLGGNALLLYETRSQWALYNPEEQGLAFATSRKNPLGGSYIARIAKKTNEENIFRGFTTTSLKGAGIRVFEYANDDTISKCKIQLELLYWKCFDSTEASKDAGLTESQVRTRVAYNLNLANALELNDLLRFKALRMIDEQGCTICPLCLERMSALAFINKLQQALGRDVHDLTTTEVSLFHINELRVGQLNHKPYNLGWGHHHCNTVAKDTGILDTLVWMQEVVERNKQAGVLGE